MLKKVKLIIILSLLFSGIYLLSYNYIQTKKIKIYNNINLQLYEEEIPTHIDNTDIIEVDTNNEQNENTSNIDNNYSDNITSPNNSNNSSTTSNKNTSSTKNKYYIGKIIIPKINLEQGFVDINSKYNKVHYNITIIKESNMPDIDKGNFILAAHSGNCSVCYFDKLYQLELDDIIEVYYNNIKYTYHITNIYKQDKTGHITIKRNYDIKTITLTTCTNSDSTTQSIYIGEILREEEY